MDAFRVEAIVNLDGRWDEELDANLERYDAAHPGRLVTFCHVDWTLAASPGFERKLVESLERSAAAGARGLKVWKSLGLGFRDPQGELLLPDDPRLHDLWEAAAELSLPVLIHTADPVAFFEPLDGRNELLELLARNPDWWYGDPRFPRFEGLMASLEALVAAHPRTTFIGAHVGCYAEDLAWVDGMLDRYPNFYVDVAARRPELGRKPRASRALFLAHPDRVLFGTDYFPPSADVYRRWYRFFETADECYPYADDDPPLLGRWTISALDLPEDVLEPVYAGNARRIVPGL
jgi:predicted TIM-barrel fold metal-dependent hydrolase